MDVRNQRLLATTHDKKGIVSRDTGLTPTRLLVATAIVAVVLAGSSTTTAGRIIYVDGDAVATFDGSDWAHAYRTLQANVLMLVVGTIALGKAMEKTGASQYYAEAFLSLFTNADPVMILAGVILLTSISTQLLSNNATAILMLPIAISSAEGLGVDPRAFIVAVCFGASACFATPIGYQTNLLVYTPGGYRFSDYLKLGIPLNLIVLILGTLLIPFFWPL